MKYIYQILFFCLMLAPFIFFNQANNQVFFFYIFILICTFFHKFFFYISIVANCLILTYFSIGISEYIAQKGLNIKGENIYLAILLGSLLFLLLFSIVGFKYLKEYRNPIFEYYYQFIMIGAIIIAKVLFINNIRFPNRLL